MSTHRNEQRRRFVPNRDTCGSTAPAGETGWAMKHATIRALFDYWNERRGWRIAPERNDIDPDAIRRVLADTFILAYNESQGHPFRIAGTRVAALFGCELKNEAFLELRTAQSRPPVRDLFGVMARG